MTDIDIRETANRVQALFAQNRAREAIQLLEQERRDEPRAAQEALDRYVAKGSETQLTALRRPGALSAEDAAVAGGPLQRLQAATAMPRFPSENETETVQERADRYLRPGEVRLAVEPATLTDAQQYDVYASIVTTRGNDAARDALGNGQQRVILGLRQENNTLDGMVADNPRTPRDKSQSGKGVYDDRLVVLWKDANGMGHVLTANKANTEPTAQYDHHAGSDGSRRFGEGGIESRRIDPSPGFEEISTRRKIEGVEVNNDTMQDLGRLGQGTLEMIETTHTNPRILEEDFALRPSPEAVLAGRGQVQRDTNADGWFTQDDINGVQNLNRTFKIHSGSSNNTDSAGCQTIHPDRYVAFMNAVRGAGDVQDRWQYVLTATSHGMFRGVNVDQAPDIERQQGQQPAAPNIHAPQRPAQDPRNQNHDEQPNPQQRPQAPDAPPAGPPRRVDLDPRDRDHPDFALHQQALNLVHKHDEKLGRTPDEKSEQMAASLTNLAKENRLTRIDHVVFSFDNGRGIEAGENVFVVQGELNNPASDKAHMKTDLAVNMPIQDSFQQLGINNQRQTQELLVQQQSQQKIQNASESRVHSMS